MARMDLKDFLSLRRGACTELAAGLGVSASLVTQWANGKPVSAERCVSVERLTGGAVRRQDLRADWQEVWPELAKPDHERRANGAAHVI